MVHEISQTEELTEQRRMQSADHTELEVEEHRAWYVLAARGLVVNALMRPSCASLSPQYSTSMPMPCSSHNTF
jgi:ketopantoate reductase